MGELATLTQPRALRPPQAFQDSGRADRRWWSLSGQPGGGQPGGGQPGGIQPGSRQPGGAGRAIQAEQARAERAEGNIGQVAVVVLASDPITAEATVAYLQSRQGIRLVAPDCLDRADVVLMLATTVTRETLATMRRIADRAADREVRFVLVSDGVEMLQLARMVSWGLVSVIPRQEADLQGVVQAIHAVARGRVELPGVALSGLVGAGAAELEAREVDVLRLLAEGLDTAEIAVRLTYSERTVRYIIHGVLSRLELRNRPHAVAFAFRNGLL